MYILKNIDLADFIFLVIYLYVNRIRFYSRVFHCRIITQKYAGKENLCIKHASQNFTNVPTPTKRLCMTTDWLAHMFGYQIPEWQAWVRFQARPTLGILKQLRRKFYLCSDIYTWLNFLVFSDKNKKVIGAISQHFHQGLWQ